MGHASMAGGAVGPGPSSASRRLPVSICGCSDALMADSMRPGAGAQLRQRPSASFQQSRHVYCRQSMQKLKV